MFSVHFGIYVAQLTFFCLFDYYSPQRSLAKRNPTLPRVLLLDTCRVLVCLVATRAQQSATVFDALALVIRLVLAIDDKRDGFVSLNV